ncbi:MAG: NCS1 family nucleobase:cation symporter-1 [Cyclobacteriaceae bacterium]
MRVNTQEVHVVMTGSSLYNKDFAPVPPANRTWGIWNIAAIWIGMAVCIPTYMLAGSLVKEGMNWWQALLTILLGNLIVLIPMILNARAGTTYGVPFPVLIRSSFGTRGAVLAALLRGLVGCGWFGIQCWIGGEAIYQLLLQILPNLADSLYLGGFIDLNIAQASSFLLFWLLNIWVIYRGISTIRRLESWAAPFLLLLGLALLIWAWQKVGSIASILEASNRLTGQSDGDFWTIFWPSLTGMVGFWATLSLNIPDFTRYARNQKAQVWGQIVGLPATMVLYSFIGIAVTSATLLIFGEAIWNPVKLLGRFSHPLMIIVAMFGLSLATLSTNIAANVVASANDIANISPKRISFRMGGYITALVGILIFPWKLVADPHGFIFVWLIGYSALLGAIGGIMICDYYLVRKTRLNVAALFDSQGAYRGWNAPAWIALCFSLIPVLPGFLVEIGLVSSVSPLWSALYSYAWFLTFFLAFGIYWGCARYKSIQSQEGRKASYSR